MRRLTFLVLAFLMFAILSCDNDDDGVEIFMGKSFVGESIPVDTKFTFEEGTYSAWVSFNSANDYDWGQKDGANEMPPMTTPCEYNTTTGEFSNRMTVTYEGTTYGAIQNFPTSFCIDNLTKMYLFTFDSQKDIDLKFPRTIAEKTVGEEGTLEGTYTSSFSTNNWITTPEGHAETIIDAEVNYTYDANTFTGTFTAHFTGESTMALPDYGIEIGVIDSTSTINFSGTWEYDKVNNTILETITAPIVETYSYEPYWVSYNNKLYMITSLTRFYQKDETK